MVQQNSNSKKENNMYENASAFISTSIELLDKETMTVSKLSLDDICAFSDYEAVYEDDYLECDEFFQFNEQHLNKFVPQSSNYSIH